MISIANASKTYHTPSEDVQAVKSFSIEIAKGEFISLVGKSGSGKSTLLHCIGLLDRFDNGTYQYKGQDIMKMSQYQLAAFRSSEIGFVFQSANLEPTYTVNENLAIPMYIQRKSRKEICKRIDEVLSLVGLREKGRRFADELSGGERQRVNIARALICDPSFILADEPCGNLDSENSSVIMCLLKALSEAGKTVLLITHDNDAAKQAKRQLRIADGTVTE